MIRNSGKIFTASRVWSISRGVSFLKFVRLQSSTAVPTVEGPPETISIVPSVHELTAADHIKSDFGSSLASHLQNRHLVEALTSEDLYELTNPGAAKLKLYCGADPSAKSLHLGNLLPLIVLLHFALRGHDVVGLVGGATGAVGDPSGRTTERTLLENKEREQNVEKIQTQIRNFLINGLEYAKSRAYVADVEKPTFGEIESVNNAEWWKSVKLLDFLATFGKHIRVSQMLARDSISSRLSAQGGLGFNEFTYQVLQAYDFWHLFNNHNVRIQVGGNDQWGNITAGTDLISRLSKGSKKETQAAYGMTVPLLMTPSGQKFGKSAGNAVFVDGELTSPFQLYQYFINTQDDMVSKLLKTFTLLPLASIDELVLVRHEKDPGLRIAQRVLAREVVDLVHGPGMGDEMAYITGFLFPTPDQPFDDDVTADKLLSKFQKSGILSRISLSEFPNPEEIRMSSLLAKVMKKSKSETKNLIKAGGVYLGIDRDQFIDPEDVVLFDKDHHLFENKLLLVRAGKQNYHVVEVTE